MAPWEDATIEHVRERGRLADVRSAIASAPVWAIDAETTALNPYAGRLRVLTIAVPGHAWVIDLDAVGGPAALAPFKPFLEAPRPIKVLHNAAFDWRFLFEHAGIALDGLFDTLLAAQLLAPEALVREDFKLATLVRHYLGEALEKEQARSDWSGALSPAQVRYAGLDALVLLPLRETLRRALIDEGLTRVAALEFGVVPAVAAMTHAGVRVDQEAWLALAERQGAEARALELELQEDFRGTMLQTPLFPDQLSIPALNLNSTQQLKQAFARLGIPLEDTHERTLLIHRHRHPAIERLLAYRAASKAESTYGRNLLAHVEPATGRIHASFLQLATFTGRFSCQRPNLQNIPATPEYRACFVPAPGCALVTADYSQIELRILASLSGDRAFRRAFELGRDLHRQTAADMAGLAYEDVSPERRAQAKSINFGLVYGRGATSLASQLGVSVEEAQSLIRRYFESYRGVQEWLARTARTALATGELRSLTGRRARFRVPPETRAERAAIERQAKNFPIQAANADILKAAMRQLGPRLAPFGARLVNCVHDELVVEAPEAAAPEAAATLRAVMEEAARAFVPDVPVVAEAKVSDRWTK